MNETDAVYARPELLQVAETVARDKGVEQDEILSAMEQAIQKAGRSKYGQEHDIRPRIDRKSGEISLARYIEVADEIEKVIRDQAAAISKELEGNPKPEEKISEKDKEEDK